MMGFENFDGRVAGSAALLWTGRSGRRYQMAPVGETGGAMEAGKLYALEDDGVIGWAGTAEDLIVDPVSRGRFQRLSATGARLFSLSAPIDPLAAMTLVWDLEGSRRFADAA